MSMTSEHAQSLLESFINSYEEKLNNGEFEALESFYHKNSVMVETDKSCLWGPKDIGKSLQQMSTECGNTTMTTSNRIYSGVNDYVIYESDFVFHTEKAGEIQGHMLQIWRKDGVGYTIYHDEYALTE